MKFLYSLVITFCLSFSPFTYTYAVSTGKEIATNYFNTSSSCGSTGRPAFLCSGVMLRGGDPGPDYHIWNPSPSAEESGGISFSYLRADAKFSKLAYSYNSGYIFYPYQKSPKGTITPEVLCSFPLDGHTYDRDNKGCGAHINHPEASVTCQNQGIYTADAWLKHYKTATGHRNQYQCGFNVSIKTNNNAIIFKESLNAGNLVKNNTVGQQNEIRIGAWKSSEGNKLPIQAFFYLNDGLSNAQYNQTDYYKQFKKIIPIIKITLPQTDDDHASFNFYAKDQAVKAPQ